MKLLTSESPTPCKKPIPRLRTPRQALYLVVARVEAPCSLTGEDVVKCALLVNHRAVPAKFELPSSLDARQSCTGSI